MVIRFLLHVLAKILLQGARQFQAMVLLNKPGASAFS